MLQYYCVLSNSETIWAQTWEPCEDDDYEYVSWSNYIDPTEICVNEWIIPDDNDCFHDVSCEPGAFRTDASPDLLVQWFCEDRDPGWFYDSEAIYVSDDTVCEAFYWEAVMDNCLFDTMYYECTDGDFVLIQSQEVTGTVSWRNENNEYNEWDVVILPDFWEPTIDNCMESTDECTVDEDCPGSVTCTDYDSYESWTCDSGSCIWEIVDCAHAEVCDDSWNETYCSTIAVPDPTCGNTFGSCNFDNPDINDLVVQALNINETDVCWETQTWWCQTYVIADWEISRTRSQIVSCEWVINAACEEDLEPSCEIGPYDYQSRTIQPVDGGNNDNGCIAWMYVDIDDEQNNDFFEWSCRNELTYIPWQECNEQAQSEWNCVICEISKLILWCTDPDACNYNPNADEDDSSCLSLDCAWVCGWSTTEDACGICGWDNSSCTDCAWEVNGSHEVDACGNCKDITDETFGQWCTDCAGIVNGWNYEDECGVCDDDPSNDNSTCVDCAWNINGTTQLDACGICGWDNSTCTDCAWEINGTAVIDDCDVCWWDGSSCGEIETTYDCPTLELNIWDSCDDGDAGTENDAITDECICAWEEIEIEVVYDCQALQANIGDTCDDGDEGTENDVIIDECICTWEEIEQEVIYNCPALQTNSGDTCDDGDAGTENDVITDECICKWEEVEQEIIYDCENLQANIGDACDDGDEGTENDAITDECICAWEEIEIEVVYDCPNLQANIGDACNDWNSLTSNDVIWNNCECNWTTTIDIEQDVKTYIYWCMNTQACNFDVLATADDGTCVLPDECTLCDTNGNLIAKDSDNDGVWDCNDVCPSNSWETPTWAPEMYNKTCTKESEANACGVIWTTVGVILCNDICDAPIPTIPEIEDLDNDGIPDCEEVAGCMTQNACNYNPLATDDDESCQPPSVLCCDGEKVCDVNECPDDTNGQAAWCSDTVVLWCTDSEACNRNQSATQDDGSCELPNLDCEFCEGWEIAMLDDDNNGIWNCDEATSCWKFDGEEISWGLFHEWISWGWESDFCEWISNADVWYDARPYGKRWPDGFDEEKNNPIPKAISVSYTHNQSTIQRDWSCGEQSCTSTLNTECWDLIGYNLSQGEFESYDLDSSTSYDLCKNIPNNQVANIVFVDALASWNWTCIPDNLKLNKNPECVLTLNTCGDGVCDPSDSCTTCAQDCGECQEWCGVMHNGFVDQHIRKTRPDEFDLCTWIPNKNVWINYYNTITHQVLNENNEYESEYMFFEATWSCRETSTTLEGECYGFDYAEGCGSVHEDDFYTFFNGAEEYQHKMCFYEKAEITNYQETDIWWERECSYLDRVDSCYALRRYPVCEEQEVCECTLAFSSLTPQP